jgi:hypothetical protein
MRRERPGYRRGVPDVAGSTNSPKGGLDAIVSKMPSNGRFAVNALRIVSGCLPICMNSATVSSRVFAYWPYRPREPREIPDGLNVEELEYLRESGADVQHAWNLVQSDKGLFSPKRGRGFQNFSRIWCNGRRLIFVYLRIWTQNTLCPWADTVLFIQNSYGRR